MISKDTIKKLCFYLDCYSIRVIRSADRDLSLNWCQLIVSFFTANSVHLGFCEVLTLLCLKQRGAIPLTSCS